AFRRGGARQVGPYYVTPKAFSRPRGIYEREVEDLVRGNRSLAEISPEHPYLLDELHVEVRQAESGFPVAHGAAETEQNAKELSALAKSADLICELKPERRFYPKLGPSEGWISEIGIDRGLLEDIYVTYRFRDRDHVSMEVFLNPLIQLIWLGWFVMIGGALYALLPGGRKRVGLSD
ncbi:MAG: cytochrome c-type biogenesis CcmF C-terminal domain-containing protein, partial [Planctomycetota bacterium]